MSVNSPDPKQRIDPGTLIRIKSLELRARTIVEGFMQGLHRSPNHGSSVEFSEYREYTIGDDPKFIDWKLYARSDRYCIKKFEAETNMSVHVLVDVSGSMGYGSGEYSKADYAMTLAATFSQFLFGQGDAVGMVTFNDRIREYVPCNRRRGQMHSILVALEKTPPSSETDLRQSLKEVAPLLKRRGMVVLFSDLLTPIDDLVSQLGYLRSGGHDVVVFNVLDPKEIDFDFEKVARFEDSETGEKLYLDPQSAKATYQKNFDAHFEAVEKACKGYGFDLVQVSTADDFEKALRVMLARRSKVRMKRRRG